MIYKYKTGYFNKVPAQVAGEEIHRLYEEGKSQPKDIVDASRPENAPLHPVFEWNDDVAAELYRQEQARHLVQQIVIAEEEKSEHPVYVRAFFKVDPVESTYEPTMVIMNDEGKRNRLLDIAKRELASFRAKYRSLTELAKVMNAIDDVLKEDE